MKNKTSPARWRKCKAVLAILVAIVSVPFVLIALFGSISGVRR